MEGAELADEISDTIRQYIFLNKHEAVAVTLFILHGWAIDVVTISPILRISSGSKGCGKSTLLTLAAALLPRSVMTGNMTVASLYRAVDKFRATIALDEADIGLANDPELASMFNASYMKATSMVPRCVGEGKEIALFDCWGPKIISGIGRLQATLEDRSIPVVLKKKKNGETQQRFRFDRLGALEPIKRGLARWAQDNLDQLRGADPEMPQQLGDRPCDNWRPLVWL